MPNKEIADGLKQIINTFNDKRVISEEEIKGVLAAIVTILAENKKGVESLSAETQDKLTKALEYIKTEHASVLLKVSQDTTKTKAEIEKATKAQNDRAFKRLQDLISQIRLPENGKDGLPGRDGADGQPGKDGSPDTAEQVRDKLETLKGEQRLDASAIKGLPDYIKTVKKAGKEMLVGGIRFFENLADVSISNKRQDLITQYNITNNRWEDGVALTVSATQPSNPKVNDIWVDIS